MESKDIENIENCEIYNLNYKLECLKKELKISNQIKDERCEYRDMVIKQLRMEVVEKNKEIKLLTVEANKYFEIEQIINRKLRPIFYV